MVLLRSLRKCFSLWIIFLLRGYGDDWCDRFIAERKGGRRKKKNITKCGNSTSLLQELHRELLLFIEMFLCGAAISHSLPLLYPSKRAAAPAFMGRCQARWPRLERQRTAGRRTLFLPWEVFRSALWTTRVFGLWCRFVMGTFGGNSHEVRLKQLHRKTPRLP